MPLTKTGARTDVLKLARAVLKQSPQTSPAQAAESALRTFFNLAPQDGIWGASEAAVRMGFRGHSDADDLLGRIASELAERL